MTTARFILAIIVLLLAAYIVAMNWCSVIVSTRNRRRGIDRHPSMVPLVSLILALIALFIYPHAGRMWILWIPLLDLSNWFLLWLPVLLIQDARKSKAAKRDAPSKES